LYPTKENVRYVDQETYHNWFRAHPKPGDIIFVLKGAPGRCALVPDPVDFCIAQDMVAVRADREKIDPQYLFAALRSPLIQEAIDRMHVGTMIPHFKKGDFNKLLIPLPDRPIQEFIGSIHMALVEKIELNRRMNETLEAMARAIFKDWFVDFGPTRAKMEGRAPYLATDIWSLFPDRLDDDGRPEGWAFGTLGDVARQVGESVKPEALDPGTPYIGLEHMPRKSIALSDWEGADKVTSGKLAFRKGDFLFGKLRPYFHKVGIAPVDGICSTDIVVLNARERKAAAFVLACISQDEFIAFTDRTSDGTKMPRTSWGRMERYGLCLPGGSALQVFNACVEPMLDRIVLNIHESRTLAATRDLLLPKLMSGEVRVKDAEKIAGEAT
jgi:type I restriction enzyme S subunit